MSANDLLIDPLLHEFLIGEVLPGIGVDASRFFDALADAVSVHGARNEALLRRREELQTAIDKWHSDTGGAGDSREYRTFLEDIGYLVQSANPVDVRPRNVDVELRSLHGPQLVVPVTNARYALNAANARWGSLYDALYGTDAMGSTPAGPGYDPARGEKVIAWTRTLLDEITPLESISHASVRSYAVRAGELVATSLDGRDYRLIHATDFYGHAGAENAPTSIYLRHNGLLLELHIDRDHPVGATDHAGVADVMLEAALSTIIDFEDSVACVDAEDKVKAYRNWLGLMRGDLLAKVEKHGSITARTLHVDKEITGPDGARRTLRSRALLLARVVGNHMMTPAVATSDGRAVPETILDTFVVAAIGMYDLRRPVGVRNSPEGSIYLVKPKLHGPEEVLFTCDLVADVERALALEPGTIKLGIMDEERRTSTNLEECIRAAADRIIFINTGFLDRTGDEIHTSMRAGAMVRKAEMKNTPWIAAYEARNVAIGLQAGFAGRAQIGKGMWAQPDHMAAMLEQKVAHPLSGASCAWVPSPTAATLHAIHYHRVDVDDRRRSMPAPDDNLLSELLAIPIAQDPNWTEEEIQLEVDNNVQGVLGYVVRWVDQGIGCSKVPDVQGIALMEDRATCRISSQHLANWLLHGIVSAQTVEGSLRRMAAVVDQQNADDPLYRRMAPACDGPAFRAAHDLIFDGVTSAGGYTESVLHARRLERKQLDNTERSTAPAVPEDSLL